MSLIETCQEKQGYKTKKYAKQKITSGNRKWLVIYTCPVCGLFHLTHKRFSHESVIVSNYNE